MASLSCWLGLLDRRRTDRLRSRRAVHDLSASGRNDGSGHAKPVYASRLGSCDSGRSEDTAAVDGVLHLMGDRVCRMGRGAKHRTEEACQGGRAVRSEGAGWRNPHSPSIMKANLEREPWECEPWRELSL